MSIGLREIKAELVEEITAHQVRLSQESYEELKRRGTTGERFGGIGKITLHDEEKCKIL